MAGKKQTLKTKNECFTAQLYASGSSLPWSNWNIPVDCACPLQGQGETDEKPRKSLKVSTTACRPGGPTSQAYSSASLESGLLQTPRVFSPACLSLPQRPWFLPAPYLVINLRQSGGAWHFTSSLLLWLQALWGRGQALSSRWRPQLAAQCPNIYWRETKYFSNWLLLLLGFIQQLTLQNPPTLNQW